MKRRQCDPRSVSTSEQRTLAQAVRASGGLVGALCLVELTDWGLSTFFHASQSGLDSWGIVPRTKRGLLGILFSPLLHANVEHLLANALPLFVLLSLLFWDRRYRPMPTLACIWLVSGLGTWLIGRGNAVHIGASSLIYGLVAFLITAGMALKSWRPAVIAILVLLFYGGLFYGVLPRQGPISWEGHLCGALAGILAARWNR